MPIVTSTYRYKPPPKRKMRMLAEITGLRIVSVDPKKSRRLSIPETAAAEGGSMPAWKSGRFGR